MFGRRYFPGSYFGARFYGDGGAVVAVPGANAAQIWAYVLPNGKTAAQNLVEINTWMFDLARVHGLVSGAPLVVTPTGRAAGTLSQSISESGTTVTVARLP